MATRFTPSNIFCFESKGNRAMVVRFVDKTTRSSADLKDTRLQLIDACFEGLPPGTIINAQTDPLRSDGAKSRKPSKSRCLPASV